MKKLLFFILILILFAGCTNSNDTIRLNLYGEAQGTYYSIIYFDRDARNFQAEIDSLLIEFDKSVSLWVPNSILSRVNKNDSNVILDDYFIDNFNISKDVSEQTNGAFDFTIGKLIKAWGFGYDEHKTIEPEMVDSLLSLSGYEKVKLEGSKIIKEDQRISFDFNAVAQGYSVDMIAEFLETKNINNYLIDIGGEVKAKGTKPDDEKWKVGIEKPAENKNDQRNLKAVAALMNISIATSGNYRKFYEVDGIRYSHTIDPKTAYPAKNTLLSVSVLHKSTAYADAYATALMVMGFEKAKIFVENEIDLEAFFIFTTNDSFETYATDGFKDVLVEEFE